MDRLPGVNSSLKFSPLTEDQLRNPFKRYDANGDNLLSKEEIKKAFEYLGSIIPSIHADRGLHHADGNNDGYVNEGEMDELVKYAMRAGFVVKDAEPFRSSKVMPRRDGHDKYYGDSLTIADANNANGDGSIQAIINANADSFIQANATNKRFINEKEINGRATEYEFTTSFGFLTKEQLMNKFKQCDVNNVRQLSRAELKKRFQYFNNEDLNRLVDHAPKLGYTVEP